MDGESTAPCSLWAPSVRATPACSLPWFRYVSAHTISPLPILLLCLMHSPCEALLQGLLLFLSCLLSISFSSVLSVPLRCPVPQNRAGILRSTSPAPPRPHGLFLPLGHLPQPLGVSTDRWDQFATLILPLRPLPQKARGCCSVPASGLWAEYWRGMEGQMCGPDIQLPGQLKHQLLRNPRPDSAA